MSKQQMCQCNQQIDDEEADNLRQENQYMKTEMRDIRYTMQGMQTDSQKSEAGFKKGEEIQKDEMEKMQAEIKGLNLDQTTGSKEEKQQWWHGTNRGMD